MNLPRTRMILLGECDELCRTLAFDGHVLLAARVRDAVDEHERRSYLKPSPTQPTRAPFRPAPAEADALEQALAVVRGSRPRRAWAVAA